MANSQHIPGLIRGHEGTIIMVENGQFESVADNITCGRRSSASGRTGDAPTDKPMFADYKFGMEEQKIPVEQVRHDDGAHQQLPVLHAQRVRSRIWTSKPAACAQVLITMAVEMLPAGQGAVLR